MDANAESLSATEEVEEEKTLEELDPAAGFILRSSTSIPGCVSSAATRLTRLVAPI